MIKKFLCILNCPYAVMALVTLLSFTALAAAFSSEAFLGLEPCILCIYQRWPYAIVLLIGIVTLVLKKHLGIAVGVSGLAFLVNSGIAAYHTGVEQHWWKSAVEGCKVSFPTDAKQSLLENIMSAPTASCDTIPWQDPVLNLSMANYNAVFCFGLFVVCMVAFVRSLSRSAEQGHKC